MTWVNWSAWRPVTEGMPVSRPPYVPKSAERLKAGLDPRKTESFPYMSRSRLWPRIAESGLLVSLINWARA